jgi:hypothetical protein
MISKAIKRAGWLRAWFSKVSSGSRGSLGRSPARLRGGIPGRKLRCEMLERRELLAGVPTVSLGADTYKTIPITSTNGVATMVANSTNYAASTVLSGSIAYISPTQGTVTGNLNGTVTSQADNGQVFTAVINSITQSSGTLSGSANSVAVTAPANLAGAATSLTGTFDTSQFTATNASINWTSAQGQGTWNGIVNSTIATPFSISLTTPTWDSAAETQIDFGFTANGNWDPVAASAYTTPVAIIDAYWATGSTASTETTLIGTVPVAWNQATGVASVTGITSIPTGANYLLLQVQGSSTNVAAINVRAPLVTGVSPDLGSLSGGTTVTITGAGFTGATAVDFGNTPVSVIVNSPTQITASSPAGTGTVDVTVTGPGGTSLTSPSDQFTYIVSGEILDNSQPGFWSSLSTAPSTWTTISSGLDGSSLVSSPTAASTTSQAAWWFSVPPGVYEISVTYTAGSNLTTDMGLDLYDGVGNWIGQIPVNEQVAPSSFTADGVAWQNLGAFDITSKLFHISTWNSNGQICVNGIQLQAAPVVDDSNAPNSYTYYPTGHVGNFTTTGSFTTSTQGAFGGSHTSSGAAGTSTATWTMPLTPGTYEVDATWPASANFSTTATYNVYDTTTNTSLGSGTVNQQIAPSGISYDGLNWQSLGPFTVAGSSLIVTLTNTNGQVSADALRIVPAYQPTPIIGVGIPGSWTNGNWTTESTGLYGSSLLSHANNDEQSQASWWFPVRPGEYNVQVTWVPGSNLSPTTPFDVYDNAFGYLSEPMVNEQIAPVGTTDQGVVWQSLGVFTISSDILHLSTWNKESNGAILVSGVRIVPV